MRRTARRPAAPARPAPCASVVPSSSSGRIAQLHVGGARHHPPDVGEARIGPHRACQRRVAEPDAAAALHRRRQRHVVDQFAPHRLDPADPRQRAAAQQDRAAGRGCRGAQRIVHPGERIEQLEEEHESRDQGALRQAVRSAAPPFRRPGRAVCLLRARPGRRGGAGSCTISASVSSTKVARRRPPPGPGRRPTACRSSRRGAAAPVSTVRRGSCRCSGQGAAIAPVPSVLPSSTRMTRNGPG